MHKVFTLHAPVQRIVVFEKSGHLFCLAEFETTEHAAKCVAALNGQNIYSGCCLMTVQFSTQKESLAVKYNSEMQHDYLVAPPPPPQVFVLKKFFVC